MKVRLAWFAGVRTQERKKGWKVHGTKQVGHSYR